MTEDKGSGNAERRSFVTQSLAQLIPRLTRPAYRQRSPAGAILMAEWAAVVGPRLAAETEPRRLSGSTLTIACAGPMAMELQHMAGALIERINTHSGRRLVENLRFVQGPVAGAAVQPAGQVAQKVAAIDGFPAGELNEALGRLQAAIKLKGSTPEPKSGPT